MIKEILDYFVENPDLLFGYFLAITCVSIIIIFIKNYLRRVENE